MTSSLMMVVPIVVAIIVVLIFIKSCYHIAEPNEALVVAGAGAPADGFRIAVGRGVIAWPVLNKVRSLDLSAHEAKLEVDCVTQQGIHVEVDGVVVYKVGDDNASITNAARRFLDAKLTDIDSKILQMLDGHLRSIIGGMTIEDIIRGRDKLMSETRDASGIEMAKLGLVIDSLQIKGISGSPEDDNAADKYIAALSAPHIAAVNQEARIAAANANQAATKAEQDAAAANAEATRDSQQRQAQYQADVDAAKAKAAQAGPLADALAKQEVVKAATTTAELVAAQTEQSLQATVRKPADAQAYATAKKAEGERDAAIAGANAQAQTIRLRADADAYQATVTGNADGTAAQARGNGEAAAIKAKLVAEADGIRARADALAQNSDAVISQTIATNMPEIVRSATSAYDKVGNMVVLNGAEGMNSIVQGLIALGLSVLPQVTGGLKPAPNGHPQTKVPVTPE